MDRGDTGGGQRTAPNVGRRLAPTSTQEDRTPGCAKEGIWDIYQIRDRNCLLRFTRQLSVDLQGPVTAPRSEPARAYHRQMGHDDDRYPIWPLE